MDDISIVRNGLPRYWQLLDRWVVWSTQALIFIVGTSFTILVSLEVISRYAFNFSIFLVNAAAGLLLVWFFMLGAGLAFRRGAHVGLDVVVERLPARIAPLVWLIAQSLILVFFLIMLWSGYRTIGPAFRQIEGALGISLLWVMLAFPIGFSLLIYHQITMVLMAFFQSRHADDEP